MTTLIQSIMLIFLMSSTVHSQDLKGQWDGTLNVQGTQLRIVFHAIKTDSQYNATMDSPDQHVSGVPVTATNFSYPDVRFEISNIGLVYEGTMSDNRITGKWLQASQSFSLVLSKKEDLPRKTDNHDRG